MSSSTALPPPARSPKRLRYARTQDPDPAPPRALDPLPRRFYARKTVTVARDLLGKWLVHRVDGQTRIGRIVEVEAYLGPGDLAAHTARGRTPRTRAMFGPPGHVYVYLVYGLHHCMNVVTEPEGIGTAVLLRALEPITNLPCSASGPGRLCKAMGIDLGQYGHDLVSDSLFIAKAPRVAAASIIADARVGVDYAGEWAHKPLRFHIADNRFVSKAPGTHKNPARAVQKQTGV